LKKPTVLLLSCLLLLMTCSCQLLPTRTVEKVVYKDVPLNTIAVNRGTLHLYSWDEWMVVKRSTYGMVLDKLNERDQQLQECLEREYIK
jgi:hypothetical protein